MPDNTRPTLKCAKLLFDNSSNFQDVIRSCPMSSGNSKSGPRPLMFGNTDREPSVGMFDPLKTCSPIRPASPDLPLRDLCSPVVRAPARVWTPRPAAPPSPSAAPGACTSTAASMPAARSPGSSACKASAPKRYPDRSLKSSPQWSGIEQYIAVGSVKM
jgi:hypothetical protein